MRGKGIDFVYCVAIGWDHPRACGEKFAGPLLFLPQIGSPPRMRGKVPGNLWPGLSVRITPAYAGKSFASDWHISRTRDHPRVCGEKDKAAEKAQHLRGSPPRMRGKELLAADDLQTLRITPARAGKRPGWADSGCQRGDHPCVCGEKRFASASLDAYWGSPPRMRGKGRGKGQRGLQSGITPAYAGKRGCQCSGL